MIGEIVIRHYPPESHTVHIELERNGETVLEETYENLAEEQKEIVAATWPQSPADYRLYTGVEGPLSTTDSRFDIFVREFTGEDVLSDRRACSVIDIQIGAPPNPSDVAIELSKPGPDGFGTCENNPAGE